MKKTKNQNIYNRFNINNYDYAKYLDKDDLKYSLNLIGIFPAEDELNLLMKIFDIQKQGGIN